mmetsp:Transcript_21591/g.30241  ORF Transcript_21591/g.30241 Transcript_21591/m.30241 type:complete len:365 (-) Transcript_21591:264-1358(-)|eukprot:CAMPEP_0184861526 /NCGR_PEP_ID=MMETSP0580-20130426/6193_1 /TAXON_ID=1118495 /ORGANISM="Dactyliosolen fragilissimus" /LENGTH=364 /DNA_ID=CAMNT_0027359055 /DNA_START=104 /DNA_END=1198 /DNA_ORIENTATION=+
MRVLPVALIFSVTNVLISVKPSNAFCPSKKSFPFNNGFVKTHLKSSASSQILTEKTNILKDFDHFTNDRLPWSEDGYENWSWRGHDINYIEMGDKSKPALLLIHGFGASSYHFRYNIPFLARDYHVFAFDMLGFGLSSKPIQDYSAEVWRDQATDFIREVIGKQTAIAGNSLGGFTALYTAASDTDAKDLIKGCILLNAAGKFMDPDAVLEPETTNEIVEKIKEVFQRFIINLSFVYTKQPARIEQVLKQVYPVAADNVDSELVESIRIPSLDPNAAEVFYRVITKNANGPGVYINNLLEKLDCPLLLCWGEKDPWIRPAAADKIQELLPQSTRISIDAGHCPHDEDPKSVNLAIKDFMNDLEF